MTRYGTENDCQSVIMKGALVNISRMREGIALFMCLSVSLAAFSQEFFQDAFNQNLKDSDRETLMSGKLLIKNIGRYRNAMLTPVSPEAKRLLDQLKSLNPEYLAEVVYIMPLADADRCLDILYDSFRNAESYPSIPYYSQSHKEWNRLYQFLDIISAKYGTASADISAFGEITPFEPYSFDIALSRTETALEYRLKNTSEIKFKGVPCVGKGKSQTMVCAFPYADKLIIYGVGGVNAPYVPILNERIQTSFINRVTTFCSYIFGKLSR